MLRLARIFLGLSLVLVGLQSAQGFSLLGPFNEVNDWQDSDMGYQIGGDIGGPQNLGEEYRWNTPTNYYAFNQNWLDFFGSNGVAAVEAAFSVFNNLKSFSDYSTDLSEVPLETRRINNRAQQLHLMDLKSAVMGLILEELGLADSERYIWTLRTRDTQPGLSCPFMIYGIIQRSFDPATEEPSSYLNGVLYSYLIREFCTGSPESFADTFPVDPLAVEHLPVTKFFSLDHGIYTTGLTRDDVGGLRYSYKPSNVNWESMSSDSTMFSTNFAGGPQLLFTSNLNIFASQALTNNAAALRALYPNLGIVATTNIYTNIYITNITAFFTNRPFDPIGTPPHLEFETNLTLSVQTWYHHTFDNLLTFQFVTNQQNPNGVWTAVPLPDIVFHTNLTLFTIETTSVTNKPFMPVGTPPFTNTTRFSYLTNIVGGEFFILPTNACDISLIGLQATLVNINTNVVISATNVPTTGFTNDLSFTQVVLEYFTNHVFTYWPVDCVTTNATLRQGINQLTFLRANYDSLVGRFFQPITNMYSLVSITNSIAYTNRYRRVVTQPDFLFTAVDTTDGALLGDRTGTDGGALNYANANEGLAGPGNIEPTKTITLNKVGPLLRNVYGTNFILNGLSESASVTNFIWGSFDGSTNDPIVYPSGTSIANLEAQILFQIITASLPDGKVGTPYPPTQLQAAGGVLPYGPWTWSSGWPSLPPGLSLSPSGLITGTPTAEGTFGFTANVTGGDARIINRPLSITISP